MMCRKPFLALATIVPCWCVLRSSIWLSRPLALSWMVTTRSSPGFIRSVWLLGVNDAAVKLSGPAGPVGLPLRWMNENAVGSMQLLLSTLKSRLPCRLLMCIDAHQCVWSQENWVMNGDQPGG